MIRQHLDRLIEDVTKNHFSEEIYTARKEYQEIAGEIYEDDKSFEARMALFLEWYIFDRILPGKEVAILESLVNENSTQWNRDELNLYKDFARSIHGMFVIKKLHDEEVVVTNLFDGQKYKVTEPESRIMFQVNDIFEGRILPFKGSVFFTGNFCFHPREANKIIQTEAGKVAAVIKQYVNEWNGVVSTIKKLSARMEKVDKKIAKFEKKLEKSTSEKKTASLKGKLSSLNNEKSETEIEMVKLKEQQKFLEVRKLYIECRDLQNRLMQKLSYMNLKWERSRNIDVMDIYSL